MTNPQESLPPSAVRFRRLAAVTLIAVYLLILVGASVRASGAGMGCPDWPKCFDRWIPPTDVSQLPANYQEIYAHRGYAETEFNAVKTWTEYLNRLMGVSVGLMVLATTISAGIRFWRTDRMVFLWAFSALFFTGFAGWLGKIVVEGNLNPVTITLHMATALVIVASLVAAFARAGRGAYSPIASDAARVVQWVAAAALLLSLIQIFMGTQVRQDVDLIADTLGVDNRGAWIAELPLLFYVHRTFSLLVLGVNAYLIYAIYQLAPGAGSMKRSAAVVMAVIGAEIASGAALYYLEFPAPLQPVHLLFAALMFGAQMHVALAARYGRQNAAPA